MSNTIEEIKSVEFEKIVDDLKAQSGVYIITAENNYCQYVEFLYNNYIYYIQAAPYFPFCGDDNYPGQWNYTKYAITGINGKQQLTYNNAYIDFSSINDKTEIYIRKQDLPQPHKIDIFMTKYEAACKSIIRDKGLYREKSIIQSGAIMVKGKTWNDNHKVINIISSKADNDGYFPGFQIDIAIQTICG